MPDSDLRKATAFRPTGEDGAALTRVADVIVIVSALITIGFFRLDHVDCESTDAGEFLQGFGLLSLGESVCFNDVCQG